MPKQLIYYVEDDESIRELVRYALQNEGFAAECFTNAEDMLAAVEHQIPELVILDVMLPGMDGIQALKTLRAKYKNLNIKIIMLTAKNSEINKVNGLDSGADDYITKPFSVLELMARIRANLRKYSVDVVENSVLFQGIKIHIPSREVFVDGKKILLTLKEYELLKMLMQNAGNVIEREKLLSEIWGYEYFGDTRTLDNHVKTLRGKLLNYGENIITVRGIGYSIKENNL